MDIPITNNDLIALVLVYVMIVVVLAIALIIQKKTGDKYDIRKIVHIGIGNFVFIWWMFDNAWVMEVFFAIPFAIVLFLAMLKDNAIANSTLGDLSKNKGHKQGLFLYVVSIIILVALCFQDHWAAASIGIIAMTWGDGFGSVIGKKFGKHSIIKGKSVEGSLGVLVVTAIMTMVLLAFYAYLASIGCYHWNLTAVIPSYAVALVAGVVVMITEMVSPGQIDNIVNSLCVTGIMILLGL